MRIHADRLVRLRMKKRWTQAQVAEKANINVVTYGKAERGGYNFQPLIVERIARALGVDRDELIQEEKVSA